MLNQTQYEKAYEKINTQFGGNGILRRVTLQFKTKKFFDEFKNRIASERWGEVAFCVERKNGKTVVIRSKSYPKGIYRIPTGGICYGEEPDHALMREIKEELGITVDTPSFLGAVFYQIHFHEETLSFLSFVFHVKETGGIILEDATEREIHEIFEADKEALTEICHNMEQHTGSWKDWCQFRLQTTSFLLSYL